VKEYFEYVEEGWKEHPPQDVWRSEVEKGHGRIERREVLTAGLLHLLFSASKFP
jgi:hypothetical protein